MDLYKIPNDDGVSYRPRKFVEYQHEVPSIHYRFIGEWIKKYNYSFERALRLCWLMQITYNEITCVVIDYMLECGMSPELIWDVYREYLNFGSARKVKAQSIFVPLMKDWERIKDKKSWLYSMQKESPYDTYKEVQKRLREFRYVGRFAADLFVESVAYIGERLNFRIKEPLDIDWENGANLTSGLFNILYLDEKARDYERGKPLTNKDIQILKEGLQKIQKEIQETYPNQDSDIQAFIGKICSFRNLFKAARYGGFHHDRELGVIKKYEKLMPEYDNIYKKCYELRSEIFQHRLLGEMNGWEGIRPERKKLWLRYGLTGVE